MPELAGEGSRAAVLDAREDINCQTKRRIGLSKSAAAQILRAEGIDQARDVSASLLPNGG